MREAVANKTVNQPPYNFIFLDTCNSAYETDLANGFGIITVPVQSDDRVFLGWQTLVEDSLQNADWSDYIYQQLQNGRTIQQAVNDANTYYISTPLHTYPLQPYSLAQPVIDGDTDMTLHGTVYEGQQHQWFR